MSFRIEYDDDQISVLDKVQSELHKMGIPVILKNDGLEHDGFMVYDIVTVHPIESPPVENIRGFATDPAGSATDISAGLIYKGPLDTD